MDLIQSTDKEFVCILLSVPRKVGRRHPHCVEEVAWPIGLFDTRVKLVVVSVLRRVHVSETAIHGT